MKAVLLVIVLAVAMTTANRLDDALLQLKRTLVDKELGITSNDDCRFQGDLIFLLDASSSLSPSDYEISKTFVKETMSTFDVTSDKVRIGLASFNRFADVAFHLNTITEENTNVASLVELVDSVKATGTGTFTHRGLNLVREEMLKEENGARPGVPKIVIVITDGRAHDQYKAAEEAKLLHSEGIFIFAVAVGRWQSDEHLQILASKPPQNYRFQVKDFSALANIKCSLKKDICKALKDKPLPPSECIRKADLLFLIDGSRSVTDQSFLRSKQFMVSFLDSLIVSPGFLRVAAMTFDQFSRPAFHLDSFGTSEEVKTSILVLSQFKTGTRTDRALAKARLDIFNPLRGDRLDEPNIIILISDGRSRRPNLTLDEAQIAKDFGISIITVGVGNAAVEELDLLASVHPETGEKMNFGVEDVEELTGVTNSLINTFCNVPEVPKKCDSPIDLMLVVDLSSSLRENLPELKAFLLMITDGFLVSSDNVQVGLITFNRKATMHLKLSEGSNRTVVENAIDSLPEPLTGTFTWKALDMLRTEGFTVENGGRSLATKMAVIVKEADSRNKEKTLEAAKAVHDAGIATVVMSIGRSNKAESIGLASRPTKEFLYQPKDFIQLFSFASKLIKTVCPGK